MTPVPRPTAKEVAEAIDCAIDLAETIAVAKKYEGSLAVEKRLAELTANFLGGTETLRSWRASLLEKGGPDAVVAGGDLDDSISKQGEPVNVAETHARREAPLEKVARFTPEEREALRVALEAFANNATSARIADEERHAATLRRMLDGDDTPGGRT